MFKNRAVVLNTLISLFISQSIFWLVFLNFDMLPPQVPLWFQQPWGLSQLADRVYIWLIPGLAVGILAVNLLITAIIFRRQPFLVSLVMRVATIANFYLLFAVFNILNRTFGWL